MNSRKTKNIAAMHGATYQKLKSEKNTKNRNRQFKNNPTEQTITPDKLRLC